MPMPFTYRHATDEWRRFLKSMRERTLIDSDNVTIRRWTGCSGLSVAACHLSRFCPSGMSCPRS